MLATACAPVVESYIEALGQQYAIRDDGDAGCWLETPLYLPDNSRLGVYLKPLPNGILEVTDYGATVGNLYLSGVTLDPDDQRLVKIGKRFGVNTAGGEISIEAEPDKITEAINAVIHAILDTAYLVYTRQFRAAPGFSNEIDA